MLGIELGRIRLAVPLVLIGIAVFALVLQQFWPILTGRFVHEPGDLGFSDFEKVDDYPLYVMRLEGDYGFSEYLLTGVLSFTFRQPTSPSCTCFAALGEGGPAIFGRNFDFPQNPALLLYTDPPDGYASVSMVNLGYFGYSMSNLPDPDGGLGALGWTPYLPFDGMNEHGLAVSMAAIPYAESPHDLEKLTIGEIQVIRLLLDRARDVEEALWIIEEYNVRIETPPVHYLLADRSGGSAIVEFVGGEMRVLRDDEPWQVMTNFIVVDSGAPEVVSCSRYRSVYDGLNDADGSVSMEGAMSLLEGASQSSTIWSCVYNMETGEVHVAMGGEYTQVLSFQAPRTP
jgi:hypothetical protein